MFLLLVLTAASICFTASGQSGTKQRIASLVVLPPLVLGYDELYRDSTETKKLSRLRTGEPETSTPPKKKELAATVIKKESVAPAIKNATAVPVIKKESVAPVKNIEPDAASTKQKQPVAAPVKKIEPTAFTAKQNQQAAVTAPVPAKKNELLKVPAKNISTKNNSAAASAKKKPKGTRENAQRSVMIDTKGRRSFRRNYRSSLKTLRKKCTSCHLNQQDNDFEDNIMHNDMNRVLQQGPM